MNDSDLIRQLAGVLVVFGLLAAAVYLLGRRRGLPLLRLPGRRGTGDMEVLDRLYLTPQHSLHVVRVGKRGLLISLHPGGSSLLDAGPLEQYVPGERR